MDNANATTLEMMGKYDTLMAFLLSGAIAVV